MQRIIETEEKTDENEYDDDIDKRVVLESGKAVK